MHILKFFGSRFVRTAAPAVILVMALAFSAYADRSAQLIPLYFPDGSEVVSVNGEPADALVVRFSDTQKERISWAVMTQYLNPGEEYDIWLEGTNDGTDWFSWWVGRAKANPLGKTTATGSVTLGIPVGPAVGSIENPGATISMVIRDAGGAVAQTAFFPGS